MESRSAKGGGHMKPEKEVREDLNNIRYYYAHRKEMDDGYLVAGEHEIM